PWRFHQEEGSRTWGRGNLPAQYRCRCSRYHTLVESPLLGSCIPQAMKLRTASSAQDKIDEEFAWRLKEIADLKLQTSLSLGDRRKTIIRSGVPLLYAHWEGFVKASAQHFINFVSNQSIAYREL